MHSELEKSPVMTLQLFPSKNQDGGIEKRIILYQLC
jgi:hypothetical protein